MHALYHRQAGILAALVVLLLAGCKEVSVTAEAVASLEVDPTQVTLAVGQTSDVRAIVKGTSGRELRRDVAWTTSSASVATVTNEGRITAQGPGSARITASAAGRSAEVTVTVNAKPVATVEVSPPVTTLAVGDSTPYTATARALDNSVIPGKTAVWVSSDPGVALVRANGMVRAQAVGSATIAATIDGIRGQGDITVRASVLTVSNVQVTPGSATIGVGDTARFVSTARASNGAEILGRRTLWSSSSPAIAEIDSTGKATARATGRTTITANVDGINGTATLDVTAATVASVEIVPGQTAVAIGGTVPLQAVLRSQSGAVITGPTVTWSSSNPLIAGVSQAGVVNAVAVGTVTITATAAGRSGTSQVTVLAQGVTSIDIQPATPITQVGDTLLVSVVLRDASNQIVTGRLVGWSSLDTMIAVIQPTGPTTQQARLIGRRVGTVRVAATSESKTDTAVARVDARAELVVTKTAQAALVKAGDTISFTLTVRNNGPSAAASVILTDTLPATGTFVDATGSPTQNGNVLVWPTVASLAAGTNRTFTIRWIAPGSGGVINTGAATSSTYERSRVDNRAVSAVSVNPADLVVTKNANASAVTAGDTITWTIQVSNAGSSLAAQVEVTDTLPAGVTLTDAGGGAVAGNVISWAVPSLDVGNNVSFTVKALAPLSGGIVTNVAAAVSGSGDANLANNRASVTVTVNAVANLVVSKSASPASIGPGGEITYTVRVRNLGPSPAASVVTRDTLPANATFVVGSAGAGATLSGNVLTWPTVAVLNAGDSVSFGLRVTAPSSGSVTNVAAAVSSTTDPDPASNRASVTTPIAQADLEIDKTGPASVNAGDTIAYTLTVANNGPSSASGIVVRDSLPAGVTFASASSGGVASGNVVTWSGLSLANAASTQLTVRALAPLVGGTLTNVARVTASTADPDASNNRSTVNTTVVPVANLTVSKSGPASVNPGQQIVYTINITNTGPSSAAGVVLVDSLPAGVSFVSATGGGAHANNVVTWNLGTLPVSTISPLSVTVTAPAGTGSLTNVVRIGGSTLDPNTADNRATFVTAVTAANLGVSKSGPASAAVNSQATYTINVTNAGPSAASAVVVTDTMPAGVTHVSSTPSASVSGNVLTWTFTSLASGSVTPISVTLAMPGTPASISNVAAVVSSTTDPDASNNRATAATTVTPAANLSITKTASAGTLSAGEIVTFTITVANAGPSTATSVVVTDSIPTSGTFVDATGGVTPSAGALTFVADSIQNGANQVYTVRWTVPSSGTVTNRVWVAAATADPVTSNNTASASTTAAAADISVVLTAPAAVNGSANFDYTITVTNQGPGRAADLIVSTPIPPNATFVSATGGAVPAGGVITFPTVALLNPGEDTVYTVTLTAPLVGTVSMTANAATASADPNLSNNTALAGTTVNPVAADVESALTPSASAVNVGDTITYNLTVSNKGPGAALTLIISLNFGANVAFVDATSGFSQTGNVLTWGGVTGFILGSGDSIALTVRVRATTSGSTGASGEAVLLNDPDATNNTASVTVTIN
jgi:uncharacterized repeat protein (TIGR01451 family)